MSGPLLLGIAAVGVGWAWVNRKPVTPVPVESIVAGDATAAAAADEATVGEEIRPGGLTTVADGVQRESNTVVVGDIPVQGSDGGQVLKGDYDPIENKSLILDPTKSTGGADPSTQRNSVHDNLPSDSPPAIMQGDTADTILRTKFGEGGGNGLTADQCSRAYQESAVWSNEVF